MTDGLNDRNDYIRLTDDGMTGRLGNIWEYLGIPVHTNMYFWIKHTNKAIYTVRLCVCGRGHLICIESMESDYLYYYYLSQG